MKKDVGWALSLPLRGLRPMKKGVGLCLTHTLRRPGPNEEKMWTWAYIYDEVAWAQ